MFRFNSCLSLVILGRCLPSASQSNSESKASYQQTREEIIARTMEDLQREEYGLRNQDKKPFLVLEKDIGKIPVQNTLAEVDFSKNNDAYVTQGNRPKVATNILKPRFEANWRYSNDRSILMGEFWLPLLQCEEESVLFCDIRLMGDDNENKEFNVGVGYREVLQDTILGNGVAGAMLWFDRRFTDRDFQFNQVTVGGEWLGEQFDLRMNGYFPIDKKKSYLQPNPNGSGQGFVGNQILVNTDQVVVEEVLPGIDFEVGSQLNFMNGITDSTRFLLGGYHFEGDLAEDITGVRTRIVSDITSDIQVGARFQHDDVRGSQTYVESTIRFPFGHKKKYKHEGLWSRLDEAPERDIDVVSNEVVTVQGINESLLNATTGLQQNVIHVDNTAAGGGDGSIETPYNTLAAAEGASSINDLIYVHRGDGTTVGQNAGITLDDAGQMLTGAGTNLLYNTDRFSTPNGLVVTDSIVLKTITAAPIITNGAGNGVDITADDVFVSGVTVDGASNQGIYGVNTNNLVIDTVTISNNTSNGIRIDANNANLDQIDIIGSTVDSNAYGIFVYSVANSFISDVNITGNASTNNTNYGYYLQADTTASITQIDITNNTASNNSTGYYAVANAGAFDLVNFTGNTSSSNSSRGYFTHAIGGGDIGEVKFTSNVANNNTNYGIYSLASGAGSSITTANYTSNVLDANSRGIYAFAVSDGDIGTANYTSNSAMNNISFGLLAQANGAGSTITTTNFTSNTVDSNGNVGIYVLAASDGDITTIDFTSNTAMNNANYGIRSEADGVGSVITTANFTSNTVMSNTLSGLFAYALDSGSIGTANFTNNSSDSNTAYGLYAYALSGGDIGTANFTGNIAMNNVSSGIRAEANAAGSTITTVDFSGNTASGSGNIGLYIRALNDGDIVQASLEENTSYDNATYGIAINDDSAAGGIVADLGGGAFGSTGRNSSYNNTNEELLVDLDGGALKAENNWWGSASGLVGGETLLQDASTVDTSPFLTSDPGL